jgi:hypothetical protein
MRTIRVVSRNYDGRLRDDYEAFLAAEDDQRLVVYAPIGTISACSLISEAILHSCRIGLPVE